MEFIALCVDTFKNKSGKNYFSFRCNGVVHPIKIVEDFAQNVSVGKKYLIIAEPRRYEDKAFIAFNVASEV